MKIKENSINIFKTLISIYYILRLYRGRLSRSTKVQEKSCVILGNGPSLKNFLEDNNKKISSNYEKICVNSFVNTPYFQILKPEYYVLLDDGLFKQYVSEEVEELRKKIFQSILQKTKWKMKVYVPFPKQGWIDIVDIFKKNKYIEVVQFSTTAIDGFIKFQFYCFRHNLGTPFLQNVLGAGIYLAIHNGFKTIYLLGAEHSWSKNIVVDNENRVLLKDEHFYDEKVVNFKPLYKTLDKKETFTMKEMMSTLGRAFKLYEVLAQYAQYLDVKVYNATEESYIDAFERKTL